MCSELRRFNVMAAFVEVIAVKKKKKCSDVV